jgi:hypothetical protein
MSEAERVYVDGRRTIHEICGEPFLIAKEDYYELADHMMSLLVVAPNGKITDLEGEWMCSLEAGHPPGPHEAWEEHTWYEDMPSNNISISWGDWPVPTIEEVI